MVLMDIVMVEVALALTKICTTFPLSCACLMASLFPVAVAIRKRDNGNGRNTRQVFALQLLESHLGSSGVIRDFTSASGANWGEAIPSCRPL